MRRENEEQSYQDFLTNSLEFSDADAEYIIKHLNDVSAGPAKLIKLLSMAFNYLAQAITTTGNTILFRNADQIGIASLTTTYQSCFRNTINGGIAASGKMYSGALKSFNIETQKEVSTTSYVLSISSAIFSMSCYAASYLVLPRLFDKETAQRASDYLLITGLGNLAMILLTMLQQFAYAHGHWLSQLTTTVSCRFLPLPFSILFMRITPWSPAVNIALGNLIPTVGTYIAMEIWCRRQETLKTSLKLPRNIIPSVAANVDTPLLQATSQSNNTLAIIKAASKKHLWPMFVLFLALVFQRATEWVNIFVLTLLLGNMQNKNLETISASLQVLSIFGLFSQGVGTGVTMDIEQEKTVFERLTRLSSQINNKMGSLELASDQSTFRVQLNNSRAKLSELILKHYQKMKHLIILSQALGFSVTASVAIALYFMREIIVKLFANPRASLTEKASAETLLCVAGISLIPDAVRLISCCSLVPWGKNLHTNVISLLSMSVIGIPVSYVIAKEKPGEEALYMFGIIRTIAITIAALLNIGIVVNELRKDKNKITQLSSVPTIVSGPSDDVRREEGELTLN